MSEAGHAGDDSGESVLLKRLFNLGVKLGEDTVLIHAGAGNRRNTCRAHRRVVEARGAASLPRSWQKTTRAHSGVRQR